MKKYFKLLGFNIQNSASPFIHSEIFKHFNKDYSYSLLDIHPTQFAKTFKEIYKLDGINITTPFKIQALNNLEYISNSAKQLGCVNTIKITNSKLQGYNTDHIGFLETINDFNTNFFDNILIIGFGGAGQMVAHCLYNRCNNIFVLIKNTTKIPKKENIASKIKFVQPNDILGLNFQLIINASTCGNSTNPYNSPIDLNFLGNIDNIFDLIYYPTKTVLIKQAQKLNINTVNGIKMLVIQAIESQKIWNNFEFTNNFINNLIIKTSNFLQAKLL